MSQEEREKLIGIVSDTHISGKRLPEYLLEELFGVDMIMHAGDILEMAVIKELSKIAETVAVRGNMDHADVIESLPSKTVVEVSGFKIGLIHGHGPPLGIVPRILEEFENVHCVVFGHTHEAHIEEREGVIVFNPGSPTDRVFTEKNTVGFIEVSDVLRPRIVDVTLRAREWSGSR